MKNKRTGRKVLISVVIVAVWAALSLMTGPRGVLSATTFTVTNTGDNGGVNPAPGAGTGTLRQAIIDANATAGADTINFQAGLTGTITLGSALPQITQDLTITGPGPGVLAVSGASAFKVFDIAGGVTASISSLTISNALFGGIINGGTLTITNSTLSGNSASVGGGIANSFGAIMTVTNSTFSGNSARMFAGGIFNGGTMTITNSTFSSNSATAQGGGIENGNGATLTVTNSTFSGNSTAIAGSGGGIFNLGTATFKNSIIANSPSGGNCAGPSAITAIGVNFSTDNTCGAGFTVVPSTGAGGLNLGPLQDNGGPTFTHALQPGSVAIDSVMDCTDLSAMPAPVTLDQRGKPRPADGDGNGSALCDAGAFEVQPCSVTCPANITQSNDPNQCGAVVSYSPPTTTGDTCGTVTCSPPSGSFFSKGTTTVNCDASGTTANPDCSFTVTVNDTQPPTITCPANITVSTAQNQCSAVVSYTVPTPTDNCPGVTAACMPTSGSTFLKGTTTVTCTATDSSNNTGSCTFTVTVNDTQPPTITCPANVTAVAAQTCPISSSATVTFPAPTVSDNCPGVTSACTPPSGSILPVGTTTVTCTATDTSNNTATCSFTVTVFSGCLQDDSNPANVVLFNAATGEYRFCCGGTIFTGVGTLLAKGCVVTIQHNPGDRRVLIKFDGSVSTGSASLQSPPGVLKCTITDRNTKNNTCACQ